MSRIEAPPTSDEIELVSRELASLLPGFDLETIDSGSLRSRVPAVPIRAQQYAGRLFSEAWALRALIEECIGHFLLWAEQSPDARTRLGAEVIRVNLQREGVRGQTLSALAEEHGISRDTLYSIRDEALRTISYILLQTPA